MVNDSVPKAAKVSYLNVNDNTCEGIRYQDIPAFSVQFTPATSQDPLSTGYLYDEFIAYLEEN